MESYSHVFVESCKRRERKDCTVTAVAVAAEMSYDDAYKLLASARYRAACQGRREAEAATRPCWSVLS